MNKDYRLQKFATDTIYLLHFWQFHEKKKTFADFGIQSVCFIYIIFLEGYYHYYRRNLEIT